MNREVSMDSSEVQWREKIRKATSHYENYFSASPPPPNTRPAVPPTSRGDGSVLTGTKSQNATLSMGAIRKYKATSSYAPYFSANPNPPPKKIKQTPSDESEHGRAIGGANSSESMCSDRRPWDSSTKNSLRGVFPKVNDAFSKKFKDTPVSEYKATKPVPRGVQSTKNRLSMRERINSAKSSYAKYFSTKPSNRDKPSSAKYPNEKGGIGTKRTKGDLTCKRIKKQAKSKYTAYFSCNAQAPVLEGSNKPKPYVPDSLLKKGGKRVPAPTKANSKPIDTGKGLEGTQSLEALTLDEKNASGQHLVEAHGQMKVDTFRSFESLGRAHSSQTLVGTQSQTLSDAHSETSRGETPEIKVQKKRSGVVKSSSSAREFWASLDASKTSETAMDATN